MALALHNTLTREKERFEPLDPKHVRMYVCGPTVYDFAHIGNARPVVVFDVLYRLLKRLYPKVTYVRNITDVDDKIIQASQDTGEPIDAITKRFTEAFHADMAALGALPPDVEPRATAHIPQMLAMIETLIASEHAYAADGHVLFSVAAMADYGRLSRHSRDELIAGARVEVAPYKKDPADFVLWKPSTGDQPGWDSPWGFGRPGWHLECSAMSETHLGQTFDIHGGGRDLVFPHHENEIAQSRCAHGTDIMAKYWVHNGYLTVEGEKMSKSLGNFYTVRQLLDHGWPGEAIRYSLLSAHYRQPLDFSLEAINQAQSSLHRLYGALRGHGLDDLDFSGLSQNLDPTEQALLNDLNTPDALHYLHLQANLIFKTDDPQLKLHHKRSLRKSASLLGIVQADPEDWFKRTAQVVSVGMAGETDTALSISPKNGPSEQDIEQQIAKRAEARKRKDFAEADRIRDELEGQGIILEDGPTATEWRRGG